TLRILYHRTFRCSSQHRADRRMEPIRHRSCGCDDYPDGAALYSTTQLMTTGQRVVASSKSSIPIPEKDCPVNPEGCGYDRETPHQRDLVIDFDSISSGNINPPTVDITLDLDEESSLVYSAGAGGAL